MSDLIKPIVPMNNLLTRRRFMVATGSLAALGAAPALAQRIRVDPN